MTRILLALLTVAAVAAPAAQALDLAGYDGAPPFDCVLQQAGKGTEIPDPHADPLCVEYDKTGQSILPGLGMVEFLSGEPARFAYAGDKCFYYQRDHWRGAIDQDDEQTETYNWDGGYFIDRARGVGGAAVQNFTLGNMSADPTAFPGFPEEWKPYFGYARGGVQVTDSYPVDPSCVEKAEQAHVYREEAPEPAPETGSGTPVAAPAPRPALRRRCARGTATVVGREVRRVVFRSGGRTVRDGRAPFAVRVRRGRAVRAVAVLADGRRVKLRAAPCRSRR